MYSMSKLSPNQIHQYLDKLFTLVDSLPIKDKGKEYLRFKLLVDFLDTWQFDDEINQYSLKMYLSNPNSPTFADVSCTYGIQNTTQLSRYMGEFIATLKKVRNIKLDSFLKELDKLHPALKAAKLSENLASINRAELFEKYGIQSIKDPEWNSQLKEILGAEISFSKEQADLLTKAPNSYQQTNNDEIFIVEELENRLAIEAVEYKRKIDELWETHKFDPNYFDSFISGPLLHEFKTSLYDHIRPLNNQEINRYLTSSLHQFKTHTPPKRHKAFLLNYHDTYWFPNVVEYKTNEYDAKYTTHVWKHYAAHFDQFRVETEKIYDEFKLGLVGIPDTPKVIISSDILKVKPPKKVYHLSFKYVNLLQGAENLTDLLKSLKKNKLVADDTALTIFRAAFSEKEMDEKIVWTGNISELAYFIKTLHNTAKKVEDTKQKQWEITISCFQLVDDSELTKDKLRAQKKPAKASIIEKAVDIL